MNGVKSTKSLLLAASVLVFLLLLAGCSSPISLSPSKSADKQKTSAESGSKAKNQAQETQVGYEPIGKVLVTRKDDSLPDGCRPRQVAGLVTKFFDAFNKGEQSKLSRFFVSEGPTPGLYISSPVPGSGFSTYDRNELLKYFPKRHKHRERLRLLEVNVGKSWRHDGAAVVSNITRKADDIKPGLGGPKNVAIVKGEINCRLQRFVIWNMTMAEIRFLNSQGMPASICPEPSGRRQGSVAIACARKKP